jgi:hypothetical protein
VDLEYNINLLKDSYNKYNFNELHLKEYFKQNISGKSSENYYLIEVDALCPCGIKNKDGFILNNIGLFEYNSQELFSEKLLEEHLREDGIFV